MKPGEIRARWARGEAALGFWAAVPDAFCAELMAASGADYVCVDQQHGLAGNEALAAMATAIAGQGALPITRVAANDAWLIGRALDVGAMGVVVPLVETAQQAREAVVACRYPPEGVRSFGPIRAALAYGSGRPQDVQDVLCAVMVETEAGLANVEEIAATEGLDAIYIGPADLALGLGLAPGLELDDPRHAAAIDAILAACRRRGIAAGIQCDSGEAAARRVAAGFQLITVAKDSGMVTAACARHLLRTRGHSDADVVALYT